MKNFKSIQREKIYFCTEEWILGWQKNSHWKKAIENTMEQQLEISERKVKTIQNKILYAVKISFFKKGEIEMISNIKSWKNLTAAHPHDKK